ncbi:IucA/IucC family protein [Mesobacillus foraminis]|uniref:IucA/IucC family protein n=1 Tax=Mesobacillus foraminis TaxID=279826 RepID=UPI0039A0C362
MNFSTMAVPQDELSCAYEKVRNGDLLEEEIEIISFLKVLYPDRISNYKPFIDKGRQGILLRLAGSMLREDIMGLASSSYDLSAADVAHSLNVPALDESFRKMMEDVLKLYGLNRKKVYKLYPLSGEDCLVFPVINMYAFDRTEVDRDILYVSREGVRTIEHAIELLQLMRTKEKANHAEKKNSWVKLALEVRNGSANLALSYAYWDYKKKDLQKNASEYGVANVIDWVFLQKKRNHHFDSSLFFEQLSLEGHNLHPGAKTKIGLEPDDVFRYSPEFDGVVGIQFVGIHKDIAELSYIDKEEEKPNAFLFKQYPQLKMAVEQQFKESADDYVFVPVHPWQMENAIPVIYKQEIKEGVVIPVDGMSIPSGATSSFRTLVPQSGEGGTKYAIKVAVNSQMTSTIRSISPNTTNNAAVFTSMITSILKKEKSLSETFVPVCECAGFNFKAGDEEKNKELRELKSRNLSAVIRENVENFVGADEVAIVGSSLFAESPFSEGPVFAEIVQYYAEERGEPSLQKAAFEFVLDYLSVALPGFLILMVKYGVGLEGHLQNSVMVYRKGRPIRMLFRDWGGARIYQDRLQQHQIEPSFYPGSATVTGNLKEMHNKVFYTVFQNHCGELILQACKHFGLQEDDLWKEVYDICEAVFDKIGNNPRYAEQVRIDRETLYQAEVDHKALTKMRLEPEGHGYSYSIVHNPLHKYWGQK